MITYRAVFGDTGGHYDQLHAALVDLGMDPATLELPAGVQIIHLGDLIHKGPKSNELVALVDKIMRVNPGNRWVQLLGNHESQHIQGGWPFWRCDCTLETIATLQRWYDTGLGRIAFGDEPFLFTHSGITFQLWELLGSPATARETAAALQALPARQAFKPGTMLALDRTRTHKNPGPVWALSTFEVFQSWRALAKQMPFIQVHGHTSAFDWERQVWYPVPDGFIEVTGADPTARALFTQVAGSMQVALDPGFDKKRPQVQRQPWLILPTDQGQ